MEHTFYINDFEGPLDLLLHLIKQQKLDIMDIEISSLTKQYIKHIKMAQEANLEVASEYILMASTLVEIKSKMLLPKPVIENEDDYEINNQDMLIKRLIEYKKYKEVSAKLKDFNEDRSLIYTKSLENLDVFKDENVDLNLPEGVAMFDLLHSLNKMFERIQRNLPINSFFENTEISVEERSSFVLVQLKNLGSNKVSMASLIDIPSKSYLIVTFLALLDLAKQHKVIIEQNNKFDDILISEVR